MFVPAVFLIQMKAAFGLPIRVAVVIVSGSVSPRIPRVDVLAEYPRFFHPLPSGPLTFGEARG